MLRCVFCGQDLADEKFEPFVENRIWGVQHKNAKHECGHESVFSEGQAPDSQYVIFAYKPDDKAASLLAKYGFSMWKNKVIFHYLVLGEESKEEFKKMLSELLQEIDKLLKSNIPEAEEKVRLLIIDKFDPYREILKQTSGEKKAKKEWSPAPSAT